MATNRRGRAPFTSVWYMHQRNNNIGRGRSEIWYEKIDFANKSRRALLDVVSQDFSFPVPPPPVLLQDDLKFPYFARRIAYPQAWTPIPLGPFKAPIVLLQEDLKFPYFARRIAYPQAWTAIPLGPFRAPIVLLNEDLRYRVPPPRVRHIDVFWNIKITAHGTSFGYVLW